MLKDLVLLKGTYTAKYDTLSMESWVTLNIQLWNQQTLDFNGQIQEESAVIFSSPVCF